MNDSVSVALKSDLIGLFEKSNGELEFGSGHFINSHREKALSDFERLGIPTIKMRITGTHRSNSISTGYMKWNSAPIL